MGIQNPPYQIVGPVVIGGPVTITNGPVTLQNGQFLAPDGTAGAPSYSFISDPDLGMYRVGANALGFTATTTAFSGAVGINGATIGPDALAVTGSAQISSYLIATGLIRSGSSFQLGDDTILSRAAAASWRLGAADAAAPVAQTLKVQGVVAGTSNTAGANWTFAGSQGTGTAAGGSLIFQVAPAGSTGSTQNPLVTALTISSTKDVAIAGALTIGSVSGVQVPATGKWFTQSRLIQTSPADGQITWSNWAATNSVTATVGASNLLTLNGGLRTTGATFIAQSATTMTDGAAAAMGTLTNAPSAGNPTKWIGVNDNGVTRWVPCW